MLKHNIRGFSLVELSIAVFVLALLLGGLLVPLQSQLDRRRYEETNRILDQAREALLGFAAANGRFPCPAAPAGNGTESFAVGGTPANGNCSNWFNGLLPAATLSFTPVDSSGNAVDAWASGSTQNRIRYAVSNATVNGVANPFTKTNGMSSATMASIMGANLLYVCNDGAGTTNSDCGTATALTSNAIAIVYSLGKNAGIGGTSTDESKNVDNNKVFVQAPQSNVAGAEFDDQVTWIGPPIVFNRLIAVGLLP
jgi:prepilin-type N-terminal cleavage/methylation domain-containing protein